MKEEIDCACQFLSSSIRSTSATDVTEGQLETFRAVLNELIVDKFRNHWYPDKPMKGNGFRCINIDKDTKIVDPVLIKAAEVSSISNVVFFSAFRFGLALWVDPGDVSYRSGHSSNVVSLFKTTTNTNCTPLAMGPKLPVTNQQLKPVYANSVYMANAFDRWTGQNIYSHQQLTSKQLKQILQRRNINRFHWTNAYIPKQVTEVY